MGLLGNCTVDKLDAGLPSGPSVTHSEEDCPRSKYVRNLADDSNHVRLVATFLLSWVVDSLMTWGVVAALEATTLAEAAWCARQNR